MRIEYMCRYCGHKYTMAQTAGRPHPGICPARGKTRLGLSQPHVWIINRKLG